jgi:hypothetical protein
MFHSHELSPGRMGRSFALLAALCLSWLGTTSAQAQDRAFAFALIGDMPYSKAEEKEFANLIAAVNSADLAFLVHVGDMQNDGRRYNPTTDSMPCTEDYDKWLLQMFQSIRHPVVITPGDNDWTDCHFLTTRQVDPLDRLAKVRATFFPAGKSLGQRSITVESQAKDPQYAKFVENLRWSMGGVMFATLHIVGSNDNCCRTPEMDMEYRERKSANIAWMRATFAKAKTDGSRGLVLMTQANPFFENHGPQGSKNTYLNMIVGAKAPEQKQPSAFDDYIAALAEEMESYDKPVAYLHGDTHRFRIDHSLFSAKSNRRFENFIRVETYGSPDIHWVKVTVDPADPMLFRFDAQIVPANVANRRDK